MPSIRCTRQPRRAAGFRPRLEILEDRLAPATLLPGFAEAVVAENLDRGTAMEIAPDGRIWVLEQSGDVEVFHAGSTAGWTALDISPGSISSSGERGLLGIAFDPSYNINNAAPDYVYLYYTSTTSPNPHNRISRFTVDNTNPDQPTLSGETVILNLNALSSATNHNGGAIHFSPIDGMLYVAVGENANGANAQSKNNLLGKILRIEPDGDIPADNPTSIAGLGTTSGANRRIWAAGLRNPFTFTFQPGTGRMFINDVGQGTWEEINEGQAGANYGWPTTEGNFSQSTYPNFKKPFYSYRHGSGTFEGFAITGGAFYNPSAPGTQRFPASFTGDYFFADYVSDWINVINLSDKTVTRFASSASGAVDLRVGADGSLYYLARGEGRVFRVFYTANQAPNITIHPANQNESEGTSATFNVSATGTAPLSYQWQRAESGTTSFDDISGANSVSFALNNLQDSDNGDRFRVVITNAFGSQTSNFATLTVTNNDAPIAQITVNSGLTGGNFNAGQQISFSGTGNDPEEGQLDGSHFQWRVDYITSIDSGNPAERPFIDTFGGVTSSNFTPATTGPYTLTDVLYRIVLTVTDSIGRSTSVTRDIAPNTATLTVTTDPEGLQIKVDGQPFAGPHVFEGVVGFQRPLSAAKTQSSAGVFYNFASWSDGGSRNRTITTPATDTTYTANYAVAPSFQQDAGANGIVSIEAENFDANVSQGGKSWVSYTATAGFSGVRAMQAMPNTGVTADPNYVTTSPRLDYRINFVKTGIHYVWIRGLGPSSLADTLHVGLDGNAVATSDRMSGFNTSYKWSRSTLDGVVAQINVTTLGVHVLNVWMREDGIVADKILLTTNTAFTPTGKGPAESPRGTGSATALAAVHAAQFSEPNLEGTAVTGSNKSKRGWWFV